MFTNADIISTYTRAQALDDGVLVEAPASIAAEVGFRLPVAFTAAAWADAVAWTDADTESTGIHQDQEARLWDALFMARNGIRAAGEATDTAAFQMVRVPRDRAYTGEGNPAKPLTLVVRCHGGDNAEPVLTISLPDED